MSRCSLPIARKLGSTAPCATIWLARGAAFGSATRSGTNVSLIGRRTVSPQNTAENESCRHQFIAIVSENAPKRRSGQAWGACSRFIASPVARSASGGIARGIAPYIARGPSSGVDLVAYTLRAPRCETTTRGSLATRHGPPCGGPTLALSKTRCRPGRRVNLTGSCRKQRVG